MHLGNGAITPECAAFALGAAGIGLGVAAVAARREPVTRERLALAAGLGGLVFAAQAINVPILPGTSAHLVGGVLLAWALGPGLGAWTMAIVLALQALVLGDGGLMAIGANILNMSLLPAGSVALCQRLSLAEGRWSGLAATAAAAITVPLAALMIVGETALYRSAGELAGWQAFAARMIAGHLWIGLAEGGLTLALVTALAALRRPALAASAAAVALAMIAFPFSSRLPDAYEAAALAAGLGDWLNAGATAIARAAWIHQVLLVTITLLAAALAARLATRAPHGPGELVR